MFVSSSESEAEASGFDSVGGDSDSLGYFKAADTSSSESDDMVCCVCVYMMTLPINTGTRIIHFTKEMQHLHKVVLSAQVNYALGMCVCLF